MQTQIEEEKETRKKKESLTPEQIQMAAVYDALRMLDQDPKKVLKSFIDTQTPITVIGKDKKESNGP